MTDPEREAELKEALDPATPPLRLRVLLEGYESFEAVIQNPVMTLLLVERPDLWEGVSSGTQRRIARSPHCPEAFVAWAIHRRPPPDGVLCPLATNPAVAPSLRRAAIFTESAAELMEVWSSIREALPDLVSPDELALLDRAGIAREHRDWPSDPTLTADELERLSRLGRMGQAAAVRHPSCPAVLLERLLDEGRRDDVIRALRHPNLPVARLIRELSHPTSEVEAPVHLRRVVAGNRSAWDRYQAMATRSNAAHHPRLPPEFVEEILGGDDRGVWKALAANPALPPEHQLLFAREESPSLRSVLRQNPSLTAEARAVLDAQDALGAGRGG
jgi:hypothetical protein